MPFAALVLCLAAGCRGAPADELILRSSDASVEGRAPVPMLAEPAALRAPEPAPQERAPRPPSRDAPALLWKAGRASLPGLSAAQAARRRAETELALDGLRAALAGDARRAWRGWIEGLLEAEDGPAWSSAARVVGRLGLRELAPPLCSALAPGVPAQRRLAARIALHELFGSWFETAEDAQPFLAAIGARSTDAFVARLRAEEARSSERLFALLELDAARARELLAASDPEVRARAAERIARALSKAELEPAAELGHLLAALAVEIDERAFHAELEALLVPLEGLASDAELERLFAVLDERVGAGWDERSLTVAQALARLAYAGTSAGESHWLARALALSGRILDAALLADERRGFEDSDAVAGVIGSLSTLAARARDPAEREALAGAHARPALLGVLRDPERAEATRQAAGVALGLFVQADDIALFDAELRRDDLPGGLVHVLLGTLGELLAQAPSAGPAHDAALRALEHVGVWLGSSDPDLRRSALALFSDARLESLVRELDPSFLLRRLEREELAELRSALIVLLGRFGNEEMLAPLLALPGFDQLAASEGTSSTELDLTLEKLAAGRPERLLAAARRLVEGAEGGSTARLRRALALVARMDAELARGLSTQDHDTIVRWAWSLHALGVPLREALDARGAFVERLLSIHLAEASGARVTDLAAPSAARVTAPAAPSAARAGDGPPTEAQALRLHLIAVLQGGTPEERAAQAEEILATFTRAEATGRAAGAPLAFGRLVRRDRARFELEIGRSAEAFAGYRALFLEDPAALEVSDLHRTSDLALVGSAPAPEGVRFAADVLFSVLARDGWREERPLVRLDDLQRLFDLVCESGEPAYLERFVELFESLPSPGRDPSAGEPAATVPGAAEPAQAWRGLTEDAGALERLRELRRGALDELARASGTRSR